MTEFHHRPPPDSQLRFAIERTGRDTAHKLDQTAALLESLVQRAEAAERRELEREQQDKVKFRVEVAGAIFGFIAAVTGIVALIVAMA